MSTLHKSWVRGIVSVIFLGTGWSAAANADDAWLARYNGPASVTEQDAHITVDSTGNVYVAGRSDNALSIADFITLKYDTYGNLLWERRVDNDGRDVINAIAVDAEDNVYVTGESQIARNQGYGYLTVKYDPSGVELWRNRHDGPLSNLADAIAVDTGGNAYVTGASWNGRNYDYLTIKYAPDGAVLWERRYDSPVSLTDAAQAIGVDPNGDIIVSGNSDGRTGLTSTGTDREDYLTLKYSPAGELLWERRHEAVDGASDRVKTLAIDGQGGIIITGDYFNHFGIVEGSNRIVATYNDIRTIKYDRDGNLVWKHTHTGSSSYSISDAGRDVAVDAAGNAYVLGWTDDADGVKIIIFKFDPAGTLLWERRYLDANDGYAVGEALALDAAGNVFVTGRADVPGASGSFPSHDYLTLKYDTMGNLIWVQRYNGPVHGNDEAGDIAVDGRGNAVVAGHSFGGNSTFMDLAIIRYVDGTPFPEPTLPPPPPPQPQEVNVAGTGATQGRVSGGVAALRASDNTYLILQASSRDGAAQVVLEGTAPAAALSKLSYEMEAAATQYPITQTVEFFNFTTQRYEQVMQGIAGNTDTTFSRLLSGDVSRFVESGTRQLRARVTFTPERRVRSWNARIDQFRWFATP